MRVGPAAVAYRRPSEKLTPISKKGEVAQALPSLPNHHMHSIIAMWGAQIRGSSPLQQHQQHRPQVTSVGKKGLGILTLSTLTPHILRRSSLMQCGGLVRQLASGPLLLVPSGRGQGLLRQGCGARILMMRAIYDPCSAVLVTF